MDTVTTEGMPRWGIGWWLISVGLFLAAVAASCVDGEEPSGAPAEGHDRTALTRVS
jgi:hypothetical protein